MSLPGTSLPLSARVKASPFDARGDIPQLGPDRLGSAKTRSQRFAQSKQSVAREG